MLKAKQFELLFFCLGLCLEDTILIACANFEAYKWAFGANGCSEFLHQRSAGIGIVAYRSFIAFLHFLYAKNTPPNFEKGRTKFNWAINAPFLERQRLYINGHHFQHNPLKIPVWRVADSCFWEKKTQTCPLVKQGRNCSLHAAGSPNLNHFWLNFLFIESKLRLPTKISWTRFAFLVRTIHPQLEINPSRMCSMYAGFSFKNC